MPLTLYPAIDLKGGKCVRLLQGDMDKATTYNDRPENQAKIFEREGFDWLHIVDLDGAFAGASINHDAVAAIRSVSKAKMQIGGGIRSMAAIEAWLDAGMARVILGTIAAQNPDFVRLAAKTYPNQVAVGIDARNGFVATQGWAETSSTTALDLAKLYEDSGVCAIIYTDIDRDGALGGVNIDQTVSMARSVSIPVIASGGVASLNDISNLHQTAAIEGVIIGRALYEHKFLPKQALDAAK